MRRRRRLDPVQIAEEFGHALDNDDFKQLKDLIDPECVYKIGNKELDIKNQFLNSMISVCCIL